MPIEKVKAERRNGTSVEVEYDMPDTLAGLTEKFGEEVITSHASRSLVIALQAYIRPQMDKGLSQEDIQSLVTDWKPGVKKAAKSPIERAREEITKMSPADRAALLKELRQKKDEQQAAA